MVAIKQEEDCEVGGGGASSGIYAKGSGALGDGATGAGTVAVATSADNVVGGSQGGTADDMFGPDAVGSGAIDADSGLLSVPGDAWGYPSGCPVAFNFQPSPLGRGDVDFQVGAVESRYMDQATRKLVFRVNQRGRVNKNINFVQIIREDNIGYATGCPVTIGMAGAGGNGTGAVDGEILFATPKLGRNGKVESISYTAVLMLDDNGRRIVSNVPAELVKYRNVEGGAISSTSSEAKQSAKETQPESEPQSMPVTPSPASSATTKKRKEKCSDSNSDDAEEESTSDGHTELRVGSEVNVLFNGSEWQATILGDKVKKGELGLMVHYKGSKANSSDWVSVDQIVSLVPKGMVANSRKKKTQSSMKLWGKRRSAQG